ncbi:MAG: DNA repair protein RecN, partial [Flavobacteriales bacterium]
TIITGETGAGKSILAGALSLILGQRAEGKMRFNSAKKCIVEGFFNIGDYALEPFFSRKEIDYDDECILRREVSPAGKSRAFINDTPVNLNTLKELGSLLVDIHSQRETLSLNTPAFQFKVLDAFAGAGDIFAQYTAAYKALSEKKKLLASLQSKMMSGGRDKDYLDFQLKELHEAMPVQGEDEELKEKLEAITYLAQIRDGLDAALRELDREKQGAASGIASALNNLGKAAQHCPPLKPLSERLDSVLIEMEDIQGELESVRSGLEDDPGREEAIRERLDELYRLEHKHKVQTAAELLEVKERIESELSSLAEAEARMGGVEAEIAEKAARLETLASALSEKRRKSIPLFQKRITAILKDLRMPDVQFVVELSERAEPGPYGSEDIRFLFSASKGVPPMDVSKVASGGELSRLILAIRSLVSKLAALPTIIFDEIDAGVSGEAAGKVGALIKKMAAYMQVIAITHLPQIAGRSDQHIRVTKDSSGDAATTQIHFLGRNERLEEIARMLSGERVTEAALENARVLMEGD